MSADYLEQLVRRYCKSVDQLDALTTLTRRDLLDLFDDKVKARVPASIVETWLPPDRRDYFLVLWVEDNHDQNVMYQRLLKRQPYAIPVLTVTAYNGDVGLVLAWLLQPDLIFSDVVHPGTSGLKMRDILAAHPLTQNIPYVLVTAYLLNNPLETRLMKPFLSEDLVRTVKAYIQQKLESS